jgi:hypothetical protein
MLIHVSSRFVTPISLDSFRGVFKTRAGKVEKALKEAGFTVTINATKPRKGSFVITRGEGEEAEKVVELLDLPRPFTKLRNLDMEEVVKQILEDQ